MELLLRSGKPHQRLVVVIMLTLQSIWVTLDFRVSIVEGTIKRALLVENQILINFIKRRLALSYFEAFALFLFLSNQRVIVVVDAERSILDWQILRTCHAPFRLSHKRCLALSMIKLHVHSWLHLAWEIFNMWIVMLYFSIRMLSKEALAAFIGNWDHHIQLIAVGSFRYLSDYLVFELFLGFYNDFACILSHIIVNLSLLRTFRYDIFLIN